ncbi:hypothetical protein DFJ74DRAFT_711780 [Hyaloraphidium curvatum]|nr:hypothetical protein DFJ74DRAFT_711780 [Hyaloraphidium curvatum]
MTLAALLASSPRFEIPIMQRRYRWDAAVAAKWWRDAAAAGPSGHRTGKAFFRRRSDGRTLLCIDGQQRITTTMLLCAALRDALRAKALGIGAGGANGPVAADLIAAADALHATVFSLPVEDAELARAVEALDEGDSLPWSRLLPSFPDRRPFFRLICPAALLPDGAGNLGSAGAYLGTVKELFDAKAAVLSSTDLLAMAEAATKRMTIMYMELLSPELDLCQVFQYLQEKTLLSAGALLYNPTPGIKFDACDLVRNLVLASFADLSMPEQERVYRAYWLPLERACPGPVAFDGMLERYVSRHRAPAAPKGELEAHIGSADAFMRSKGVDLKLEGALVYARFVAAYDHALGPGVEGEPAESWRARVVAVLEELLAFALEIAGEDGVVQVREAVREGRASVAGAAEAEPEAAIAAAVEPLAAQEVVKC